MIRANWMSFFFTNPVRYETLSLVFRSQPFCDSGDTKGVAVIALAVGTLLIPGCFARRIVRIEPIDSKYLSSENGLENSLFINEQLAVLDDARGGISSTPPSIRFDRFIGDVLRSSSISTGLLSSTTRFRSVRVLLISVLITCFLWLWLPSPANRRRLYDLWWVSNSSSELDDAVLYWITRLLYFLLRCKGGGFSRFRFDGGGLSYPEADGTSDGVGVHIMAFSIGVSFLKMTNNY